MKSSTRNNNQDEFVTITNCSINDISFQFNPKPEKDHTTIHLTSITKGDKTIQTEIIAHFWGGTATKTCTHLHKKKGIIYNIYGKVLSRKILLEQETKQIELIEIYVTRFGIQKIENTTMKQEIDTPIDNRGVTMFDVYDTENMVSYNEKYGMINLKLMGTPTSDRSDSKIFTALLTKQGVIRLVSHLLHVIIFTPTTIKDNPGNT